MEQLHRVRVQFTANWITILRFPCIPVMMYYFYHGDITWGMIWYALSILPDILDGIVARWQQRKLSRVLDPEVEATWSFWRVLNTRGLTSFGSKVDPLADKGVNIPALLQLGLNFVLSIVIWIPVGIDLVLQFIVRPLEKAFEVSLAANSWGKAKTWWTALAVVCLSTVQFPGQFVFEWLVSLLAWVHPWKEGHIDFFLLPSWVPYIPLAVVIVLASMSLRGHMSALLPAMQKVYVERGRQGVMKTIVTGVAPIAWVARKVA